MPALPVALAGTWVGSALADYPRQGRVERLEELLDIAAAFQQQRQVPLFCGEFGVYLPNSAEEDRVFWYQVVRQGLEERSIAWTIWDYQGGFGLFERGSNELFEFDLNIPLVRALGLEEPLQREFVLEPEVEGFELYRDFIGPQMVASNWISGGEVDYYSEEEPAQGRYCVHWSGAQRYNYLGFDFRPVKDLSRLVEAGYALELWVRGDRPGASFDVRLMDTNREGEDLPWRMRYTVTDKDGPWDGQWHPLRLPLNHFSEHGAWDGEWFAPRGQFDWTAVDRFEIVAEHRDLEGVGLWFDDIRVAGAQVASAVLEGEGGAAPAAFALHPNYPNPFNASTTIAYALPVDGRVEIAVYNAQGQRVRTLLEAFQPAGLHALVWDGLDQTGQRAASGLYFYRMATADFLAAGKMALVR
jgi:endoglucanase